MTPKLKDNFDMVYGTQQVFRLLLEAIANPARPVDLSAQFSMFASNGRWLAPALTLLDNKTCFFWNGLPELAEEIRFLSGASQVPLENADFVFLSLQNLQSGLDLKSEAARNFMNGILSQVKGGSYRDPHDSALIFISGRKKASQSFSVRVNGPGVPPEGRELLISEEEAAWIEARELQKFEYPRGVEMIFIREDNSIFAITRKAVVSWPM